MNVATPLELSEETLRRMLGLATDRIVAFTKDIPNQPVDTSSAMNAAELVLEPIPRDPVDIECLLDDVFDQATRASLNPVSPGFMGYVPGGGLLHAGVADLVANALNRYIGVARIAPALSQMEASVISWFCEIMGYPTSARGFLTSGGSLANLSAVVTARHTKLGDDFSRGVIYVSDQVHHCIDKAARIAGFADTQLRVLPTDSRFRLDAETVADAIEQDRAQGLEPFLLIASAGTTNTGAVDPLDALADLADEEDLWFHVDGAYGGFFRMTERGKAILRGIERADSVVLDPHKSLFLPYGTGALLVRNGQHLKATHSSAADYLPDLQDHDEVVDFCEISPELTRPFRGLRVWLPMKMHGIDAFRDCLDEKLDLANWIQEQIAVLPDIELVAKADLSILAFVVKGSDRHSMNTRTRNLIEFINQKNRVHLTGTRIDGTFAIRIAVVSYRTHLDRMEMLLEDLQDGLRVC
ncbi:MAG: aminotransferase class V-fold PLP-dependent enzyme [Gammaproteobacteria bacterium]|nr:aminotransferase class V-fold PLP-dependent enzyme [Gammaproteobacteria bacterium]